jgi:hypothetical protein
MRITIDIDGLNPVPAPAPATVEPRPEVVAQAAVIGTIDAGPAPDFSSAALPSAPGPSQAGMSGSETAPAISAGAAPGA